MVGANIFLIFQNVGQWSVLSEHVAMFIDRIPTVQLLFQSIMGFVLRMYRLCDMTTVWHVYCVTWLLCDMCIVWHDYCVTCALWEMCIVWFVYCVTCLLCGMCIVDTIKFHKNPCSGTRIIPCGLRDRHNDLPRTWMWYVFGPVVTTCTASFSTNPRFAHNVYLCVLCGSQKKQRLFPYTALTEWFV